MMFDLLSISWPLHDNLNEDMKLTHKLKLFACHHFTDRPYNSPKQEVLMNRIERLDFSLEAHYEFLSRIDKKFEVSVLEYIDYQDNKYPIYSVDYQPESTGQRLFVLAGSHGNEEAGLIAVEQYVEFLSKQSEHNLAVRIITPHNPVGSAEFSRYNGQGYDTNRDFAKQKTKETQAVVASFEEFKPTVAISLHEGPQEYGTFFFTNRCVDEELITPILKELKDRGVTLADKSYFGNKLRNPGQLPARGIFQILMKLWKFVFKFQGFGAYCADQNVPAIVIETPWTTKDRKQRVDAQLIALEKLTSDLSS